jgi:uncharacterized caspase-like protein
LPLGGALIALADQVGVLNALPRVALVIGNAKYRNLPPLGNPANDASSVGGKIRELGFETSISTDLDKQQMEQALAAFARRVASTRAVALFYFAGHGLQVAWRNYLLPIDARIDSAQDVAGQAVDLVALIDALRKARNAMNVLILDACRDNPFAVDGSTGKGLSQMDAPVGTFLAYATSPGRTASDGSRKHGLYTEHLLTEIAKPEAKIEDVFKRVRLGVRRESRGEQIPWESTSLEDDFYFVPSANVRKASKEELDRQYAIERAAWGQIEEKLAKAERSTGGPR